MVMRWALGACVGLASLSAASPVPAPSTGGASAGSYHSPAWLPNGDWSLKPAMDQSRTNGGAKWGTPNAPFIDKFLNTPGQPMPQGQPWGGRDASTNPYTDCPNTGMTRKYEFTVSQGTIAPDGVQKQAVLVNGQFPGPLIEANWGDWIEVTVTNNLPDEGTALHWHGLTQKATPWFDGVPGVQQCPIAPGSTFTYRFQADLYGSSWYHGHYSAQYAGGLLGPLIIHGPTNADYDHDLGPILLTDWYHQDYFTIVEQVMAPISEKQGPPQSNNNLINGKMNYPCANTSQACTPNAGVSKFNFQSGKKYRLRLINAGAEGMQKFSVDNHKMTIIANDYVEVQPYETDVVTLGIGQRTDVIVEATGGPSDAVWMRSNLGTVCSLTDGISTEAVAAIYYEKADNTSVPNTTSTVSQDAINDCKNDDLSKTQPFYSLTPDPNPSTTENMVIEFHQNNTGADPSKNFNLWFINNSTFRVNYNDPVLLEAKKGKTVFDAEDNLYNFGSNKTVRLVLINKTPISHPMHLHGHNMFVLAEGFGTWDANSNTITRPSNPQRRDVQMLQAGKTDGTPAYSVVQIDMDNPGVWPFHCHIAWHVSGGLYFQLLEQPDKLVSDAPIPEIMPQTCRDWTAWTGGHIPDMIDSGL